MTPDGLGDGIRQAGLDGYELSCALERALETADLVERWFGGERLFAATY